MSFYTGVQGNSFEFTLKVYSHKPKVFIMKKLLFLIIASFALIAGQATAAPPSTPADDHVVLKSPETIQATITVPTDLVFTVECNSAAELPQSFYLAKGNRTKGKHCRKKQSYSTNLIKRLKQAEDPPGNIKQLLRSHQLRT